MINSDTKNNFNNLKTFNHEAIEKFWSDQWIKFSIDTPDIKSAKKPFYNLMMYPYPSAEGLHVGNMYAFTGSDIYGRYKRLKGFNVLEPIGLDGFGIHSENYAFKINKHPKEQALISEEKFYRQLKTIGAMFDWNRILETYNPNYYKWTQWLFIQMFKNNLAYRAEARVNWCPGCKTVLADEQVINGQCERCGNKVVDRMLKQWFINITAYAEKLLQNISSLKWSDKIRCIQKEWIGKKEGINIIYPVVDYQNNILGQITCFTTRPDTNFGATFVVIAPEHPFVEKLVKLKTNVSSLKITEIKKYCNQVKNISLEDRKSPMKLKTGVDTNLYCLNMLNNIKIPLYISDFILNDVGTGAVVGVPGHDKRDFEFAKKFKIPIKRVVIGNDNNASQITEIDQVQEDMGIIINSDFLDGLETHKATQKIMDYLEEKKWGQRTVTYHLRDWLVSRQRYWGAPIPMVYCDSCAKKNKSWFTQNEQPEAKAPTGGWDHFGWYPVTEDHLPVLLPFINDYKPSNDGVAPLAKHAEFYKTTCPECGKEANRETDVADTFLDSSWYFLRYPTVFTSDVEKKAFDIDITKKWLPVDMYTGGAEHAVLHLMYSRFVCMVLHDLGYLDFDEPFTNLFAHGLVIKDGAKMSKSKGNIVNPDIYIQTYGADALRMYLMFMGPFSQGGDFRDAAMEGMSRWIKRVWTLSIKSINLSHNVSNVYTDPKVEKALHKLICKVDNDIEERKYNTSIASMMEFTNLINETNSTLTIEGLKSFILILSPFAPFLTEEVWQMIHKRTHADFSPQHSVHTQNWPTYDKSKTIDDMLQMIIQINGKVRDVIEVDKEKAFDQKYIEEKAQTTSNTQKYLTGTTIQRTIFVPGKIINFVVI